MKPRYALLFRRTLFWAVLASTAYFFVWCVYAPYHSPWLWNDGCIPSAALGPMAMLLWCAVYLKAEPTYARVAMILLVLAIFIYWSGQSVIQK